MTFPLTSNPQDLTNNIPLQGTASQFTTTNPLLNYLQLANETDTGLSKIGDGVTFYNSLAYRENPTYFTIASGTDTYVCTYTFPDIKAYYIGLKLRVEFTNPNTTVVTINLNGFGAKSIKKKVSANLVGGDILASGILDIVYDGTNFQALNVNSQPVTGNLIYYFQNTASAVATYFKQLTTPYTPSTDMTTISGVVNGQVLYNFITEASVPNLIFLSSGLYQVNIHAKSTAGTKVIAFYCEIWETNAAGVDIAKILTTGTSYALISSDSDIFVTYALPSNYTLTSTASRIATRIIASVTGGGSAPNFILSVGGSTDSRTIIPSNIPDLSGYETITLPDLAPVIHASTSKVTPVDNDELPLIDSSASNVLKKLLWSNVKATLKTYFDTLYTAIGGFVTSVNGTANRITSTGGTTPIIDISTTFEALLGKVANRIDQNNASTTSAQLASVISDETGTGNLVFSTSPTLLTPTFTTSATVQLLIGGSAVGSNITYESTTGIGTTTAIAHSFTGGTNGATSIANLYNDGQFLIGTTTRNPNALGIFKVGQGTSDLEIGESASGSIAIWGLQGTNTSTNYSLRINSSNTILNNAGGSVIIANAGTTKASFTTSSASFTPGAVGTGAVTPFTFTAPKSTNQTLSTEINGFYYSLTTDRQWATGALTTEREFLIDQPTYRFLGASTITNAATLAVVGAPVASTNATITNSYSIWAQAGDVSFDGTNTRIKHLKGSTTAPTGVVGTGAGTSPSAVTFTTATDLAGIVNVTTGTLPTAAATVLTVTFNTAYGVAPVVVLTPANAATALLSGVTQSFVSSSTTTTFVITAGSTGLVASTAYSWIYHVIQ